MSQPGSDNVIDLTQGSDRSRSPVVGIPQRFDEAEAIDLSNVDDEASAQQVRGSDRFAEVEVIDLTGDDDDDGAIAQQTRHLDLPALDLEAVGLRLSRDRTPSPPPPPPRPKYSAPPALSQGYTRTIKEGETVVCARCDSELGQGQGVERELWAVRECGHVRNLGGIWRRRFC